mmetsp:Transcript_41658/g.75023  ORF Transcript_41658/g.75023 Transcript_41658/m.75023 type:complete len:88 (+) Transcript_41658:79-342(+)
MLSRQKKSIVALDSRDRLHHSGHVGIRFTTIHRCEESGVINREEKIPMPSRSSRRLSGQPPANNNDSGSESDSTSHAPPTMATAPLE